MFIYTSVPSGLLCHEPLSSPGTHGLPGKPGCPDQFLGFYELVGVASCPQHKILRNYLVQNKNY